MADMDFDGVHDFFIPQGRGSIGAFYSLVNGKGEDLEAKLFNTELSGHIVNPYLYAASRQFTVSLNDAGCFSYTSYTYSGGRYHPSQSLAHERILNDTDIHIFTQHEKGTREINYYAGWQDDDDDRFATEGAVHVIVLTDILLSPSPGLCIERAQQSVGSTVKAGSVMKIVDFHDTPASNRCQQWLAVEDSAGNRGWLLDDTSLVQEWRETISEGDD